MEWGKFTLWKVFLKFTFGTIIAKSFSQDSSEFSPIMPDEVRDTCVCVCVCVWPTLNGYAEHEFRVLFTILGCMSRHFLLHFDGLLFWNRSGSGLSLPSRIRQLPQPSEQLARCSFYNVFYWRNVLLRGGEFGGGRSRRGEHCRGSGDGIWGAC